MYLNNTKCSWGNRVREITTRRRYTVEMHKKHQYHLPLRENLINICSNSPLWWNKFILTLLQYWHCPPSQDYPNIWPFQRAHRRRRDELPGRRDSHCLWTHRRDTKRYVTNQMMALFFSKCKLSWRVKTHQQASRPNDQKFPWAPQPNEKWSQPSCSRCIPYLWSTQKGWFLPK